MNLAIFYGRSMMIEKQNLTITIADICGSTSLYEVFGDSVANRLVTDCLNTLSKIVERHHGLVIKNIGDSIMCSFSISEDSIRCACEMQSNIAMITSNSEQGMNSIAVRIGMHSGPVIYKSGDLFGDTVNVAARLADLAKPGQILISEETIRATGTKADFALRSIGTFNVRGRKQEIRLHEILCNQNEVTLLINKSSEAVWAYPLLRLWFNDQSVDLDHFRPTFTIGRQQTNDLVVEGPLVSRTHAKIDSRQGKFILMDNSANGTYLFTKEEANIYLHLDEYPLYGNGIISLGHPVIMDSPLLIHFMCIL